MLRLTQRFLSTFGFDQYQVRTIAVPSVCIFAPDNLESEMRYSGFPIAA